MDENSLAFAIRRSSRVAFVWLVIVFSPLMGFVSGGITYYSLSANVAIAIGVGVLVMIAWGGYWHRAIQKDTATILPSPNQTTVSRDGGVP